ncbi:MAG TPA: DUF1329 domain-containing protein, partial [Candidatus Binataceae bacterium]|nr:DUF1329 domain-containing protein [Candidatus Binataceae bacterium]
EMRHLYVVSATPRKDIGTAGNVLDKETVVYMDSEAWFAPYVDAYDQKGQLWRSNIFWLTYRDRPVPDARVAIYPFKREFVVGASRFDVQSGFATMCYLPGQHSPERECWYINMGAVDRSFFTIQAMVKAAP